MIKADLGTRQELMDFLKTEVRNGDCVLFKGSNSMGVSVMADAFKKLADEV